MKLLKKLCAITMLIILLVGSINSYAVTNDIKADSENNVGINSTNEENLLIYDKNSEEQVQNIPPNAYYSNGQEVMISNQVPSRVGYAFSGWNTFADGSGTQYGPQSVLIMPNSRIVLYAQWQANMYILTFNKNTNDQVENMPQDISYNIGEDITIPSNTPVRVGYTFLGWNTTSEGTGAQYQPNEIIVGLNQDSILYAQWAQNTVDLVYESNTADVVENLPQSQSFVPGTITTISEQVPTRNGYTFNGWNSESNGTGVPYNSGQSVLIPDNGLIIYAQWTKNQNTLNFEPNTTDNVDNLPENISYISGNIVTIPDQVPIRNGYSFTGWNTTEDGTGTVYNPGDSLTGPEEDLTLYAQWEKDNTSSCIIWLIIGTVLFFIFIGTIIFLMYYCSCDCE